MFERLRSPGTPVSGPTRRDLLRGASFLTLAAGAGALTGCSVFSESSDSDPGPADAGNAGDAGGGKPKQVLRLAFNNFAVLDPQVITDGMWLSLRGIFEGLVSQNDEGTDVVPGVAEKWSTSADGLTYTFTLRTNAKWSNGDPVVASDFERTLKRLFTPSQASAGGTTMGANSYQAATGIKGAADFLAGTLTDWSKVGVKASGDHELTVTLENPNAGFLLGLTHPSMLPLHMDSVEKDPKGWQNAGNLVSNGPFKLSKWTPNASMTLVPNEHYWDKGKVFLSRIDINLQEAVATGTATVPYENGEVDMVGIADADAIRFQKDPTLAKQVHAVEKYSIVYLAKLRSKNPALDDVRVRKALSLAAGRADLTKIGPGMAQGTSLVVDNVPGWDASLAIKDDVAQAKKLLADAGFPGGKGLPTVRILAGVQSPIIDALVQAWQKNLGIKAKADIVEAGVYVERRWAVQADDYIGFYFGTFAGLHTWPVMVGVLWGPKDVQKLSLPAADWAAYQQVESDTKLSPAKRNAELDAMLADKSSPESRRLAQLVEQASATRDENEQLKLFKEAAKLRDQQFLYVPLLWNSAMFAVAPKVRDLHLRAAPDFFYFKGISIGKGSA
ncbi:peptide/nickel transport system substrate-binding protein/oligopeptide transport system substrate-binding protein [Actinopolymorpha cephalotaxi]|uniref:ABC-type oligopeptide transport system substrate-binding subunit n=1 Tax=Actinopolymorpha cephalotaxi TaxID=504797 RepID=A0A1I2RA68_9ACTN|nr:peptide ABC transporter substrate-binding protein [Actinopolymorpha cephalotaxi]NYH82335.1 ABC-type oligopeptide transport system substrate-binding subunit [Actinopolymorpha cephalotaxi]SFG36369.1 peptide/nickel transport system substrate-binding protein/oligopeptide transport system substrate-binding protein [Actinopolymorpha cephalotaxi]